VLAITGLNLEFSTDCLLGSKQFKDLLHTLAIPCYEVFGSLQGHALPEIILDEHVLDLLHLKTDHDHTELGVEDEIRNCLNWGFQFIIYNIHTLERCLADPDFPKNKLLGSIFDPNPN